MKIGRAITEADNIISCAKENDGRICKFDPDKKALGEVVKIKRLLTPVEPTKIVAVGLNYRDHAKEFDLKVPTEPVLFLKPPSSVIGPDEAIVYPKGVGRLDFEAELAIVISKKCKDAPFESANDYILGYTCFNDVTARDIQEKDGQWTRAKSFDTFAPIGPWIITDINDAGNLRISSKLNNELKQSSSTSNMIFNIYSLVSFISSIMTLEPFDVIATGTPPGVGPMSPGDVISVAIEGIGELKNRVIKG
ncbi:MAG: fumarylacetoacetate hydrolase family protein [Thermodesulfobacteriota bacterium]|nr:fumarylacetoacetate hydrolase family protein [Thermodesulfobacteriota bacterium]